MLIARAGTAHPPVLGTYCRSPVGTTPDRARECAIHRAYARDRSTAFELAGGLWKNLNYRMNRLTKRISRGITLGRNSRGS